MKVIKIICNVLFSLIAPGIILISKKQISGYFIYSIFVGMQFIKIFSNLLYNFYAINIYLITWLILFVIATILYLRNVNKPNNRKYYLFLSIFGLLVYICFYFAANFVPIRRSNSEKYQMIENKIDMLEKYVNVDQNLYGKNNIDLISNFINDIPIKSGYSEIYNCNKGIYILIRNDSTWIFYDKFDGSERITFSSVNNLNNYLLNNKISVDSLTVYFAFSSQIENRSILHLITKLQKINIKTIKMIYIMDKYNIESKACNPNTILKIKERQNEYINEGKSQAEALAKAISPLVLDCYLFSYVLDTVAYIAPNDRAKFVVNNLNTIKNSIGCDIEKAIDITLLLTLPWIAYSEIEIDIKSLIENIDVIY